MRGALSGLSSPHPFRATLPGIYQEDPFTERLLTSFDDVLAPVLCTLDNLPAYLDVQTVPEDLLPWLSGWIGLTMDVHLSPQHQREALQVASDLLGWQGTRRGIERAVEAVFGLRAVVQETGGSAWSADPDTPMPGQPGLAMVVQVFVRTGQSVDEERLNMLVTAVKPAHVVHRIQVLSE